jgi:hypothetical protein
MEVDMKDFRLEVGDELYYKESDGSLRYASKIDRVTKTMAFAGDVKYKIEMQHSGLGDPCTEHPGAFDYHSKFFYLFTDEIKEELIKQIARRKLEKAFIDKFNNNIYQAMKQLTDEQLKGILNILENKE